jgi:hypothetical protein
MTPIPVLEHARTRAGVRRSAAGRLWLYNVGLGCIVGGNLLVHVPDETKSWLFGLTALISTTVFLTLVPAGFAIGAAHVLERPRALGAIQAVLWSVFHVALFANTRIYNMFRYHWNGQVNNLLYTRGSEDSIHLGWQVWTAIGLGLGGMAALEYFLWRRALRHAVEDDQAFEPIRRFARPAAIWLALLVPAIFVEKTIYAQAELSRDHQVKALARVFPMYPALSVEDVASWLLGVDLDDRPRVELTSREIDYPLVRPAIDPEGPRPNVLMLVVDCLRYDMIAEDVAPHMNALAGDGARVFRNHFSGGNSTRFGILSLIYGLHGSYWFPILENGTPPVMLDALLELGYEPGVFATASQNYPELRATAWARVNDKVHDDFPSLEAWRRDVESSDALIEWIEERAEEDRPFFGFLLLDSAHQPYSHPPDATHFEPSALEIDYLAMTRNEGPDPDTVKRVFNRYKNAVHHADACLGRVLHALERTGLEDDTIVIITGDHGEEFRECGFFGHTSAYTRPQVHVPLLVRGPGIEPGVEHGATSHVDVPATLLELLGADPADRPGYTVGGNLLAPEPERRRVIGGWNELGLWVPDAIVRIPLAGYAFDVEVYDIGWTLIPSDAEILKREEDALRRVAEECNRFLVPGSESRP